LRQGARVIEDSQASWCRRVRLSKKALWTRGLCKSDAGGGCGGSSQRWLVIEGSREHDDLERWYGGRALPWHRADLGFFGAHALSRCARVARMDSCDPLLATHFLLEKQVEARRFIRSQLPSRPGGAWQAAASSAGGDGGSGLLEQSKTRSICHRAALSRS